MGKGILWSSSAGFGLGFSFKYFQPRSDAKSGRKVVSACFVVWEMFFGFNTECTFTVYNDLKKYCDA